jgi:hypothetical protein
LLREYAATNGITILTEYVDIETARQSGRTSFGEMVKYFLKYPGIRTLLVEKTHGFIATSKTGSRSTNSRLISTS